MTVPTHVRIFHCDVCGGDQILDDVVSGGPLLCDVDHAPNVPCTTIACLGCAEHVLADRRERVELARLTR